MITIIDKQNCSGCYACYSICPKKCIVMNEDSEGFRYPEADTDICINCGLCEKICSIRQKKELTGKLPVTYACINKDDKIRNKSSSGGIFTLIAEYVIDNGGAVFGAAFDYNLDVHHIEVTNKSDLSKIRGSKYLQSTVGNTYCSAKEYLKSGKMVLFSGTPCQISGLRSFLQKDYSNLICQDIICYGVPSSKVWQKYLRYLEDVFCRRIKKEVLPNFRSKAIGWKQYSIEITFEDNTKYTNTLAKDIYMKAFLKKLCLRPSCYNCRSKSLERESDITLADFWGVENIFPEMDDDKGISLLFLNTEKGKEIFSKISDKMQFKNVNINDAVKFNPAAYKSVVKPKNRGKFFGKLDNMEFDILVKETTKSLIIKKVINKSKQYAKKLIRS